MEPVAQELPGLPPQVPEVRKRRVELMQQAIALLREAGVVITAQSSDFHLNIIADDMEVSWSDYEGTKLVMEGLDWTDRLAGLQVRIGGRDYPLITVVLKPRPMRMTGLKGMKDLDQE